MLHMFKVQSDEQYWYAAETKNEAKRMFRSDVTVPEASRKDKLEVTQEPDNERCAVKFRKKGDPWVIAAKGTEIARLGDDDLEDTHITTWGQLAQEHGRGFFSSTV